MVKKTLTCVFLNFLKSMQLEGSWREDEWNDDVWQRDNKSLPPITVVSPMFP